MIDEKIIRIKKSPIIAVVRNIDENKVLYVIEALMRGGINNIEITYGSHKNVSTHLIKEAKKMFRDDILIGAGTVLTIEQLNEAIDAGAEFIFSPVYNKKVVKETLENKLISIPGCFTPTEIYEAYLLGAQMIKVFPANILGPSFIKDILAPMPFLNLIPTGGINKDNLTNYIKSGAIAVGMGSSLLNKQIIDEENYSKLTELATKISELAKIEKQ